METKNQNPPESSPLVFDIETDGLIQQATQIFCVVVGDPDTEELWSFGPEDIHKAIELLGSTNRRLCGHNIIAFDIPMLQKFYPEFKPKSLPLDTKVWSHLVAPDLLSLTHGKLRREWFHQVPPDLHSSHKLKAWGYRLGILKGEPPDKDYRTYSQETLLYCQQDVRVTMALYRFLLKELTTSMSAVDLEMTVAGYLQDQHTTGVCFNREKAELLSVKLQDELKLLLDQLHQKFPPWQHLKKSFVAKVNNRKLCRVKGELVEVWETREFNPASTDHVVRCLGERFGWKPTVFTDKGNPKMDEDVLLDIAKSIPEAQLILKYRVASKILSYISGGDKSWLKFLTPEGRIHHEVNVCGAGTRRMTHSNPNLGQVPSSRAYLGKECRSLFSPPPGFIMCGIDADQLELRTLSHFLYPYDGGKYAHAAIHGTKENQDDIHWLNAKAIGVDRDSGKTIFYAYIYGSGVPNLGQCVTKSWDTTENAKIGSKIKYKLERNLKALVKLKEDIIRVGKERGYLIDLDGQMFRLRSNHSSLNELNQRAGAIIMKRFEVELVRLMNEANVNFRFLLHVHDEIQLAIHHTDQDILRQLVARAFEYVTAFYKLHCPITGSAKFGSTWEETH